MGWVSWLWSRLLLMIDGLLGTRLVERELARKQVRIERLIDHLAVVDDDLGALADELAYYRLALCLIELKARSERGDVDGGSVGSLGRGPAEAWLRFAPHSDGDETLLDDAIECLVKPRLATIDADPVGQGRYVYRLHPDWTAIVARLSDKAVAPELLSWLEERAREAKREA